MATPKLITVTGKYTKIDGTPESGRVTFKMPGFLRSAASDEVISPGAFYADLDIDGRVSFQVFATDDANWNPSGWQYHIIVALSNSRTTLAAPVPYASQNDTIDLGDMLPAPQTGGSLYAPFNHTHPGDLTLDELNNILSGYQPAGQYLTGADIANLVSYETLTEELVDKISKTATAAQAIVSNLTVNGTFRVGTSGLLEIGADTNLYRAGPNLLATDDGLNIGGDSRIYGGLQVDGAITNTALTNTLSGKATRPGQMRSGSRYAPVFNTFAPATVNLNEIRHVPVDFHSACTITELAVEATAAVAGALVRILVSRAGADGRPSGNYLYVSGQLVASAIGKVGTGVISVSIPAPGRYFFAALPQSVLPTLRSIAQVPAMYEQVSMATYNRCCYSEYGVTGVPVTVGTLSIDAGDAPRVEALIG